LSRHLSKTPDFPFLWLLSKPPLPSLISFSSRAHRCTHGGEQSKSTQSESPFLPSSLRANFRFLFPSALWAFMWPLSYQIVPLWAQFPSILVWLLIRGHLMQIRVPEDLRLLGLLEIISTAIQVREADLHVAWFQFLCELGFYQIVFENAFVMVSLQAWSLSFDCLFILVCGMSMWKLMKCKLNFCIS